MRTGIIDPSLTLIVRELVNLAAQLRELTHSLGGEFLLLFILVLGGLPSAINNDLTQVVGQSVPALVAQQEALAHELPVDIGVVVADFIELAVDTNAGSNLHSVAGLGLQSSVNLGEGDDGSVADGSPEVLDNGVLINTHGQILHILGSGNLVLVVEQAAESAHTLTNQVDVVLLQDGSIQLVQLTIGVGHQTMQSVHISHQIGDSLKSKTGVEVGLSLAIEHIQLIVADLSQQLTDKEGKGRGLANAIPVVSGFFGALCGSGLATASTMCTMLGPRLEQKGYKKEFIYGLIPALLYYLSVFITVDLRSKKLGLLGMPKDQLPSVKAAMKSRGHLAIPFLAVIYMIIRQYTISFAALVGIILVLVVSPLKKETRLSFKQIAMAFVNGGQKTVSFGVSCACVGMIIGVATLTGVGNVLGNYILQISQGNLFITLFLVMIMSIIMGMGMPTVAVYIVLATVAAPVLVKLGIPVLTAHFFCFYFGILACITPPVAVPSYAAAAIAGSNPSKTGWVAFKMAFPTFLVPYVFVYEPGLQFNGMGTSPISTIVCICTCILGVYLVAAGLEGYCRRPLVMWKRVLAFAAGICCIVPEHFTDIFGVVVLVYLFISAGKELKAEAGKVSAQ